MINGQETGADIISEMRRAKTEFPFVYLMGEPDTPEVIDAKTKEIVAPRKINIRRVTVSELADRFEAAYKRECGNAAALREALEFAEDELWAHGLFDASKRIASALAKPPRNCDNAATWLDLYAHFHPPKGMREMPPEWVDAIAAFCQWLVATPKEGGAK